MECYICKEEIHPQLNDEGEVLWDKGNNPDPLPHEEGQRCCNICNATYVLTIRVAAMQGNQELVYSIAETMARNHNHLSHYATLRERKDYLRSIRKELANE